LEGGLRRDQIAFIALMTMIGTDREWRMMLTHSGENEFRLPPPFTRLRPFCESHRSF